MNEHIPIDDGNGNGVGDENDTIRFSVYIQYPVAIVARKFHI